MWLKIKLPLIVLAIFSLPFVAVALPSSSDYVLAGQSVAFEDDEDIPEVTDRVARVSYVSGEAKIRRNGADEWETVTLNLPVVEGDELVTGQRARLELQFNKDTHLRLDEDSFLRVATLKEEGLALSVSQGRASLMVMEHDKDSSFIELDVPKTTIAVQKPGRYFLDAGQKGDSVVEISVDQGGEARIYSDNAGFTLKDQRLARVFIEGANAGEWEISPAFSSNDAFYTWVVDREEAVARRLKDAHYDQYYDQDIYGADDLNDHGDWINTNDHGYVWSPSRGAIAQYSNWSPYRYGHWRWVPPYGWTWVNDEPWGWATYHHGRWFNFNGRWVWSPYGYYRSRRSWWSPALVVIRTINNRVCWFPLSYYRKRYNFNAGYQRTRPNPATIAKNPRNPRTIPIPIGSQPPLKIRNGKDPIDVPTTGIITADPRDFGSRNMRTQTAPEPIAKTIYLDPQGDSKPVLPDYRDRRRDLDVITEKPRIDPGAITKVGAAPRRNNAPLDGELQKTRIFGGRTPRTPGTDSGETRKTGITDRPVVVRQPTDPVREPSSDESKNIRSVPTRTPVPSYIPPQATEKTRNPYPVQRETPRYDPPKQNEKVRSEPPVRVVPRNDPPPVKQIPRNSPPPVKQAPRNDPPASKSEPKGDRPSASQKAKPID